MQPFYLLAPLLASRNVMANHTGGGNQNIPVMSPIAPLESNSTVQIIPPHPVNNTTLPDGDTIVNSDGSCWADPKTPPILSNGTKYDGGTCGVCVSQSFGDNNSVLTLGSLQQYSIRIRDASNHDMGTVSNETLAAFGGHTGGRKTTLERIVAGKKFHLWTMRDPGFPWWAAVYMDWGGPGPADPFAQPPMVYSYASEMDYPAHFRGQGDGVVQSSACGRPILSPGGERVHFQCGFVC